MTSPEPTPRNAPGINGDAVRAERKRVGWTQSELAQEAHVSLPTVQRAERGDDTVTRATAAALSDALGVGLDAIYTDGRTRATRGSRDIADDVMLLVEDLPVMRSMLEALTQDMVVLSQSIAVIRSYVEQQQDQHA